MRDEEIVDDGIIEVENTMPLLSGALIRSKSKRIMNQFVIAVDRFEDDKVL